MVSALKKIARVRLDCSRFVLPERQAAYIVDLEGDADAEHQRQRDDVGEIERQPDQYADLKRHRTRNQERRHPASKSTSTIRRKASQEQQADDDQRAYAGVNERPHGRSLSGLPRI